MITKLTVHVSHPGESGEKGMKTMAQMLREIADKLEAGNLPHNIDDELGRARAILFWEARPS